MLWKRPSSVLRVGVVLLLLLLPPRSLQRPVLQSSGRQRLRLSGSARPLLRSNGRVLVLGVRLRVRVSVSGGETREGGKRRCGGGRTRALGSGPE